MFRITRETDYGLILMTDLAERSQADAMHVDNATDLARKNGLPLPMVSKVLKRLAHAGLLASHRGLHGGYTLARPAAEISVAQVIGALEGPIALTACLADGPGSCDQEAHCRTQGHWRSINRAVADALDGLTLADMVRPARAHAVPIELLPVAGPIALREAALAAR